MDLSSVLATANKQSLKRLESIEKILSQQLKVDKKNAQVAALKERREVADAKRDEADKKSADNHQQEMIAILNQILGHVDEVEEKLDDVEEKGGKGGEGGLLDNLGDLASIGTLLKGGGLLAGLKGLATAVAPFAGLAGAAGAGALGVMGIKKLMEMFTGANNEVNPKTGEVAPGGAATFDAKGDKGIATFLQTTKSDQGIVREPGMVQTRRGTRPDSRKFNAEIEADNQQGADMGMTTIAAKSARIAFYQDLAREMAAEKEKALKERMVVGSKPGRGGKNTPVYGPITDERKAEIEKDYEERLARMQASYEAEGLSRKDVRIEKLQKGGPLKVPGSGSGDKVPMALPAGSFVLNRNASNFLFRQEGGMVDTMLEPGERVFMPGQWDQSVKNLNDEVPRFQSGGSVDKDTNPKAVGQEYGIPNFNKSNVGENLRYLSTGDAMQVAKLQTGGLVLFQGHGDVPPGHSQPGTDGPHSSIQGKYKPTAEQYFMDLIGKKAAATSDSITYAPPTGKYKSGFDSGANWARMRDLRNKGQSAIELHADGYDGRPGKFKGRPGVLPGTATGPTDAVGEAEKNIRRIFGMYGGTRSANILELDNIMNVSQTPDKYVNMLVQAAEGTGAGVSVETINSSNASGGGGDAKAAAQVDGTGTGVEAVLKACEANIGLAAGVSEQCANTTRAVLKAAGHPSAKKTTSTGDLEKDGVPAKFRAPSYAASFGGRDMGSVTDNYKATKPGDVILWKGTYGVEKWGADAITHVGIKGEGSDVYHHGSGPGWRKQSGYPISSKFAYGVTLAGTGAADGSKGTPSKGGETDKTTTIGDAIKGGVRNAALTFAATFLGIPLAAPLLAASGLFGGENKESQEAAKNVEASPNGTTDAPEAGVKGDSAKSNEPYSIAQSIGFDKKDWDIYRNSVGAIESGNKYNIAGGSGGHYDGRWQLGDAAKTDAARYLGEEYSGHGNAARKAFQKNGDMQERYFAAFTAKNHEYLMSHPKYKAMSNKEKFEVLGYAHNQGAGGASTWLDTGVVGQDGFGTKADKYAKALRSAYASTPATENVEPVKKQTGGLISTLLEPSEPGETVEPVKKQTGGLISTLLEPGETVGTMEMWNQAIPRFQSGGSVNMGGTTTSTSKTFYDKTRGMDHGNQSIVVMGGGGGTQSRSSTPPTGSSSNPVPQLNSGPSMASLTDYINRVSWSSVF